jgi:Ca2+-binding EF-hand superfamily protein
VFKLFQSTISDMSGDLNVEELVAMYEKLGKSKNVFEVKKELAKFDKNNSGTLNLYEYLLMTLGGGASPFLK